MPSLKWEHLQKYNPGEDESEKKEKMKRGTLKHASSEKDKK